MSLFLCTVEAITVHDVVVYRWSLYDYFVQTCVYASYGKTKEQRFDGDGDILIWRMKQAAALPS